MIRIAVLAGALALAAVSPAAGASSPPSDPLRPPAVNWKMYGGDPQRTFATGDASFEEDTVLRFERKWLFTLPNGGADNSVTASPAVYRGRVYFGDWKGRFYALDARDGSLIWERDLKARFIRYADRKLPQSHRNMIDDRGTVIYSTALAHKGLIYTGVGQLMFALRAKTGRVVWTRNLMDPVTRRHGDNGAPFYSSPTIARVPGLGRRAVFVGGPSTDCVRGSLYALHPRTGKRLWSYFIDGGSWRRVGERTPNGKPAMGGGIWTSPTISPDGRTAFITTSNACGIPPQPKLAPALIALKTGSRTLRSPRRVRWVARPRSFDIDDRAIANTPNYMANVATPGGRTVDLVGYADKDGSYRAYWARDLDSDGRGDRLWRTDVVATMDERTGGGIVGGGTGYANGRIFSGSFLGPPFMHAFDAWSGDVAWQSMAAAPTFGGLGVAGDMVFKGDEFSPGMKVYDAEDGAVLRNLPAPETVVGAPALVDRHIIVTLGSSRPWEGLATNPEGVGAMAFYLPDEGALNEVPPVDPNPPLPRVP